MYFSVIVEVEVVVLKRIFFLKGSVQRGGGGEERAGTFPGTFISGV